jgi:competence protein ComEC
VTSFAAWIGSLPLVAYYFNIFTPVSTPANLLAVPLCALVLISDLASLLLVGWFPAAAELFNHAGWALMECIRITSNWFAQLPSAYYYVSAPSWTTTTLYYAVLIAATTGWLFIPRWRVWKLITLAILSVCWLAQTWRNSTVTELTVLPEFGAGVVYVDAPGRKNDVLIDCGSESSVQSVTKPFLQSRGVNRLANLVLTHGDRHRVGGAEILDELFAVENVWASSVNARSQDYRRAIADFRQYPGKLKTINRGDHLGSWTVLHPEPTDHFPQADDNTLVLTATLGPARLLLLSDLGRPGQGALLWRYPDLRADIVVSGLPAATEALSDTLLETVRPRVVIVTDSQFPASARAGPTLHERLENRNVQVLYTRTCGAIIIEFTKTDWVLKTMNGETLRGRN